MNDLIRQNIQNVISSVESKLEQTRYWIDRMKKQNMDVGQLELKQMQQETRLNQLRGLL